MALKDFICVNFSRNTQPPAIFDLDGNNIFRFNLSMPYGLVDYDDHLFKMADGSLALVDYEGTIKHYDLDGTVTQSYPTFWAMNNSEDPTFSSNKDVYFLGSVNNSLKIYKRDFLTGVESLVKDLTGASLSSIYSNSLCTAIVGGVEYLFYTAVSDPSTAYNVYKLNLSTGVATQCTPPIQESSANSTVFVLDDYIVAVYDQKLFKSGFSDLVWVDTLLEVPGALNSNNDMGYLATNGNSAIIRYDSSVLTVCDFSDDTMAPYTDRSSYVSTFNGTDYQLEYASYLALLSTGNLIASGMVNYTTVEGDTGSTYNVVEVNPAGEVVKSVVEEPITRFSVSNVTLIKLDHHRISGTVTGTGSVGASVSLISKDGFAYNSTVTDANGDYSLDCFGSAARKVLVVSTTGASQVHDSVVPVSVV